MSLNKCRSTAALRPTLRGLTPHIHLLRTTYIFFVLYPAHYKRPHALFASRGAVSHSLSTCGKFVGITPGLGW
jgi:hypothetical protein